MKAPEEFAFVGRRHSKLIRLLGQSCLMTGLLVLAGCAYLETVSSRTAFDNRIRRQRKRDQRSKRPATLALIAWRHVELQRGLGEADPTGEPPIEASPFLEGLTTPWDFGAQDDTVLRLDVLWEPTDAFSLRVTHNDEQKAHLSNNDSTSSSTSSSPDATSIRSDGSAPGNRFTVLSATVTT